MCNLILFTQFIYGIAFFNGESSANIILSFDSVLQSNLGLQASLSESFTGCADINSGIFIGAVTTAPLQNALPQGASVTLGSQQFSLFNVSDPCNDAQP